MRTEKAGLIGFRNMIRKHRFSHKIRFLKNNGKLALKFVWVFRR